MLMIVFVHGGTNGSAIPDRLCTNRSRVDIREIGRRMWCTRVAQVTRGWLQTGGRAQREVDGNNRQLT
jgi:hypothetical protein